VGVVLLVGGGVLGVWGGGVLGGVGTGGEGGGGGGGEGEGGVGLALGVKARSVLNRIKVWKTLGDGGATRGNVVRGPDSDAGLGEVTCVGGPKPGRSVVRQKGEAEGVVEGCKRKLVEILVEKTQKTVLADPLEPTSQESHREGGEKKKKKKKRRSPPCG